MWHHAKNSITSISTYLSLDFRNLIPTHFIYNLLSTDINWFKRDNYNSDCYQCLLGARFVCGVTSKVVKLSDLMVKLSELCLQEHFAYAYNNLDFSIHIHRSHKQYTNTSTNIVPSCLGTV